MVGIALNPAPQVITLQPQQQDRAVEVIVRAFGNDPLLSYLTPDPGTQARLLGWFARVGLQCGAREGRIYTTPEVTGVAVWLVPGRPSGPAAGLWRAALRLPLMVGLSCFWRFLRFVWRADRVHRRIISKDHWHLFILVVDPEYQGQGWGSELLQPVLEEADASGRACYLETTNPQALPFYRQHGFNIVHHGASGPGGPDFWGLLRPPGASAGAPAGD